MLVDANVLLYAADEDSPFHDAAARWVDRHLNGSTRVGLPWPSLTAFLRISTHPRIFRRPLTSDEAADLVGLWLSAPAAWVPVPTSAHAVVLDRLVREHQVTSHLVPDADLAALAVEHGLAVVSADTDFARFTGAVRWINPFSG